MKTDRKDFSFEESLTFLDELNHQLKDETVFKECDSLNEVNFQPGMIMQVNCTVMYINVLNNTLRGKVKDYALHAVMNLATRILRSSKTLKYLEFQADASLLALFDTTMKKEIEEIITLAAQVRSINEVVLKKFGQDLSGQSISIGINYGPVELYCASTSGKDYYVAGSEILKAMKLSQERKDNVVISETIFINLPEEMTTKLFQSYNLLGPIKYYYAPLINIMMRKWVVSR